MSGLSRTTFSLLGRLLALPSYYSSASSSLLSRLRICGGQYHHYYHHSASTCHYNYQCHRRICSGSGWCQAAKASKAGSDKRVIQQQGTGVKGKPVVDIWKNMTVAELAKSVKRPIDQVFEAMLYVPDADAYDSPKSQIDDLQVIRGIAKTLGFRTKIAGVSEEEESAIEHPKVKEPTPRPVVEKDLAPRPPVVAILGHVDHGKTTLLDMLRNTSVAASEAGGITQHIGAFVVKTESGKITFLDTPGHAAFSALRQRGANGADLAILVVAAEDGVMEQTKESIRMIKEANVPMIIAVNKIDKPGADIERTKKMLLQEGIQLEDFGGEVQCVPISALKGTNVPTLVEAILIQAELQNLRSENKGPIEGTVLEASVDTGRGKLCTALVQRGALRKGAILVAGSAWAKVRGMFDENGKVVQSALPSTPVEIIGWRDLPSAGDEIFEVENERTAKAIIDMRISKAMGEKAEKDAVVIEQKHQDHMKEYKEKLAEKRRLGRYRLRPTGPRQKQFQDDDTIKLPILVKADVDGSAEALLDVLETYDCHDQCRLDVVHYGVGDLTENDVKLAETFGATIYGFNVKIPESMKNQCRQLGIEFRISNVIYRLIESMKADIEKRLPPKEEEEILGEAAVLALFKVTEGKKKVNVAGSRCTKGILKRDAHFRIVRGEEILLESKIHSMRHLKSEAETIKNGLECGLAFDNDSYTPQEGDNIICYTFTPIPQKSAWDPGF